MKGNTQMSSQPAHLESAPHAPHCPESSLSGHSCGKTFADLTFKYVSTEGSLGIITMPGNLQVLDIFHSHISTCSPTPAPQGKFLANKIKEPLRKYPKYWLTPPALHQTPHKSDSQEVSRVTPNILENFAKDHCLMKTGVGITCECSRVGCRVSATKHSG